MGFALSVLRRLTVFCRAVHVAEPDCARERVKVNATRSWSPLLGELGHLGNYYSFILIWRNLSPGISLEGIFVGW